MISSRKTILLCLVLGCISMTACAARGPAFQLITDLREDEAVVYVYRLKYSNEPLIKIKPSVTIGDTKMCSLPRGGYIVRIVEPGEIKVIAKGLAKRAVSLQLERGESGYVRLGNELGPTWHRLKLTAVLGVLGETEISKCKKVCGD